MRVMILDDGSGQKVIDVSTDEKLEMVSLTIVNERFNSGYYPAPTEPVKPKMTRTEINKLKDETIKDFGVLKWKEYNESLKEYQRRQEKYKTIAECIEQQDGSKAVTILKYQSQYQGEDMSVMDVLENY